MAQYISKGDIFGRIGTGLGQGIADQLPKEVERGRLASGLRNLEQEQRLTPFQQFSRLAAIPGITPQMIQSGSELLRQQGIRQSFANAANKGQGRGQSTGSDTTSELPPHIAEAYSKIGTQPPPSLSGKSQTGANYTAPDELEGESVEQNPLRPEVIPAKPWSDDRWVNEMADAQDRFPSFTNSELAAYVDKKQQRELEAPAAQKAIDDYKKGVQDEANTAFDNSLATKLQKTGEATYAEVPGTLQNKIKRKMVNELAENPKANIKDVADKWSDLAFRRATTLGKINVDANKSIFSQKPSSILSNLNAYSKSFKDVGDSENYQDILIDKFKFSPQRAAQIAFHPSKPVIPFLESIKRTSSITKNMTSEAIKRANGLTKVITPSDSVQAIARNIKDKDPYFDEAVFFQELKDILANAEEERDSPFTGRQKEEINQGQSDRFPNWADIWYFPISHGISTGARK